MPPATLLHLSDLHLGEDIDDAGEKDAATIRSTLRGGGYVMQSHDMFILAGLRTEIELAARHMGSEDGTFDVHVVTGDISTEADSDARFAFARRFLTDRMQWKPQWDIGLGIPADRLLCVPG